MANLIPAIVMSVILSLFAASPSAAGPQKEITIGAFGGGFNLPTWIADKKGFFSREGLLVNVIYTPRSTQLITDIVEGRVNVYMGAIDNVFAYREGQGEAKVPDDFDITAIFGLSSGFASVIAAPEVKNLADLKGKTIAVDAITTGYAFATRALVERAGLGEGEVKYAPFGGTDQRFKALMEGKCDATITLTPFDIIAVERGYRRLIGVTETFGDYQGTVAALRASWAKENRATVVGLIRAYKAAIDWIYDSRNRSETLAILAAGEPQLSPAQLEKSLDYMTGSDGFFRDLKINERGAKLVLELRSKYATPKKTLTNPLKYIDYSYLDEAFRH
jgi:ABC-type nitrate/sulfonate/bicarbonate transport system substrate-binding protein